MIETRLQIPTLLLFHYSKKLKNRPQSFQIQKLEKNLIPLPYPKKNLDVLSSLPKIRNPRRSLSLYPQKNPETPLRS